MARLNPDRYVLKITGESGGNSNGEGINFLAYDSVAESVSNIRARGIQIALIPGGGNIFRGREKSKGVDPIDADSVGMLATVMNGIGLKEALVRKIGGENVRLMSAVSLHQICEDYIVSKADHHLTSNRVVIVAAGLGMSGYSTDSAVAQRGYELGCKMILKASTVDGVYDCDPRKNPGATKYNRVSFETVIQNGLSVMDATAFTLAQQHGLEIFVFHVRDIARLPEALLTKDFSMGTLIHANA